MRRKSKIDIFKSMLIVPVSLWMILFVAIPFIYILVISFMTKDTYGGVVFQFTFENYKNILNVTYLKIFLQSILISGATTVICILIAYPFTYFVAQKTEIKKTIFMSLVVAPFLVNSLIRLFSWINFLRKDGILNSFLINLGIISEPLQLVYNKIGVMVGLGAALSIFLILITLILIKLYQRVGGDMEELGGF